MLLDGWTHQVVVWEIPLQQVTLQDVRNVDWLWYLARSSSIQEVAICQKKLRTNTRARAKCRSGATAPNEPLQALNGPPIPAPLQRHNTLFRTKSKWLLTIYYCQFCATVLHIAIKVLWLSPPLNFFAALHTSTNSPWASTITGWYKSSFTVNGNEK